MIYIEFRPILQWPGKPTAHFSRQRSRFSAPYRKTLECLDRELSHLKAKHVVVQLDCDEREIKRDGTPRADARCRGPGVIVSFESTKGAMSFPCDTFTEWQDNLRAIALALESLRTVDRYGVTRNAEQYRGWAALPDKSAESVEWLKRELGMNWNGSLSDGLKSTIRTIAITRLHPDKHGGDDSKWKMWQAAATVLGIEV